MTKAGNEQIGGTTIPPLSDAETNSTGGANSVQNVDIGQLNELANGVLSGIVGVTALADRLQTAVGEIKTLVDEGKVAIKLETSSGVMCIDSEQCISSNQTKSDRRGWKIWETSPAFYLDYSLPARAHPVLLAPAAAIDILCTCVLARTPFSHKNRPLEQEFKHRWQTMHAPAFRG